MKTLLLLIQILFYNPNTLCVEIVESPDIYDTGKVLIIPADSTALGYSLTMWYDEKKDTLYPYSRPCLQCYTVQILPIDCE